MLRNDWKKNFLSSYFYSTPLSSLILPNPLKILSARILPMSSFWTEGGFALALFSEHDGPWIAFAMGIEFFTHSHNSERIVKGFGIKATEGLYHPNLTLPFQEDFLLRCSLTCRCLDAYET